MKKKEIKKLTIKEIVRNTRGNATLKFTSKKEKDIEVSAKYLIANKPKVGGFYVKYEDGTEAFIEAEEKKN